MTDPITMQKQLAQRLNATLETPSDQNLAKDATLEHGKIIASPAKSSISEKDVIALDELQKKLQSETTVKNDAGAKKTHQPILIAAFMFTMAIIIAGGEYLL